MADMMNTWQSPRSTHTGGGSSNDHGSRGSSPRHTARGRNLDLDLRNAPCYHAAIMRLLPYAMRRGLTVLHPHPYPSAAPVPPPPGPRQHPRRSFKHYRKDWRQPKRRAPPAHDLPSSFTIGPPPATPRARGHKIPAHAPLDRCFKSETVYLEVQLAELRSQHNHASKTACAHMPDAHCFGVCWQLLKELSRMKTPFAQAFSVIYRELDRSIHSSFVAAKTGSVSSTFQLVPFFELIRKLGERKLEIEVERGNLEADMYACQAEVGRVEKDIKASEEKLKIAEGVGRQMEGKLSTILEDLEATLAEVRTLQEDMLQLRRKMQKAKVSQSKAHEVQYEQMMRLERHAKLEENYKAMWQELQEAEAEIEVVRHEASDSVLKEDLVVAKAKVDELQKTLVELQEKADQQITTSGELTPRPFWEELLSCGVGREQLDKSTAELLIDICKQNVALTHSISQLHEDCAVAQASIIAKKESTSQRKGRAPQAADEDHVQNAATGTPRANAADVNSPPTFKKDRPPRSK